VYQRGSATRVSCVFDPKQQQKKKTKYRPNFDFFPKAEGGTFFLRFLRLELYVREGSDSPCETPLWNGSVHFPAPLDLHFFLTQGCFKLPQLTPFPPVEAYVFFYWPLVPPRATPHLGSESFPARHFSTIEFSLCFYVLGFFTGRPNAKLAPTFSPCTFALFQHLGTPPVGLPLFCPPCAATPPSAPVRCPNHPLYSCPMWTLAAQFSFPRRLRRFPRNLTA